MNFTNPFSQKIRKSTSFFLVFTLIFNPIFFAIEAKATNITDVPYLVPDGSTNTITDRAPNNVPIVNIAAPNSAGVSLNNFTSYNVTDENQILNNYKGLTVNTTLAGQIYGNPNFSPTGVNEANIIINQVTSTNRSSLAGYIEIAGRKADLIIANGNGIDIAGNGYINTSRLSLVTGNVNLNNTTGEVNNFTIATNPNSNIIITGVNTPNYVNLGLDAANVDYADIITRTAQIAGDIHAKELNIKLGNDSYNYATKEVTSTTKANAPTYALDSSYLGGMYANKIKLVASENGVGVRSRGDVISNVSDIDFDSKGDVEYERLQGETNIKIASTGKVTQGKYATVSRPALTKAKNNIGIDAAEIELNDSLSANNFYAAQNIDLVATGLIKNNSNIKGETGITINSASLENTKQIYTPESIVITTSGLAKNTTGSIEALKNITINSGSFNNAALIHSGIDTGITSSSNFTDSNQIRADRDLIISTNSGIAYNDLYAGRNLSLTNQNSGNIVQNSKFYAFGTASLINNAANGLITLNNANSLTNNFYVAGLLTLSAQGKITNNSQIKGDDNISITSASFENNSKIILALNHLILLLIPV